MDDEKEKTIKYKHDNCSWEEIKITRGGYKDSYYNLNLQFTDATDYERVIMYLQNLFTKLGRE